MVHDWFSIPSGAVPVEGARLQQHVCCEGGKYVVGDRKVCVVQFVLIFLHVDDELIDTGVSVPHFVKAEDEFYAGRAVEASTKFGKIIKEILWRDGGEEVVRVT